MNNYVILQGSIKKIDLVQKCINSIKIWLNGELIISCWEGEEKLAKQLYGYDKIIFCTDPGPGPFNGLHPTEQHCNLKRQIFGFREALEYCNNGIIFKLRNDCVATKNVFLYYNFEKTNGPLSIFENKIIVSNIMTTNPYFINEPRTWFRISDWLYLGAKEDLKKMCDIYDQLELYDYSNTFFGTEHILSFNLLKKYKINNLDFTMFDELKKLGWDYILNNFIVMNTISTLGIKNIDKWKNQPENLACYVTQETYNFMKENKNERII